MIVRDIRSQVVEIDATGCPYELDDGRLVTCYKGGSPTFYGRIRIAQPPYTSWSDLAVDTGVAQIGRYAFKASNGNLFFTTARDGFFGNIIRSTDGGNTWAKVFQGTAGDQIWHMCEDSSGNLFANSYGQVSNLGVIAKEVYKSTNGGATWFTWLTIPQTASGLDNIIHVHGIYCDRDDNLLVSCGEWYTNRQTGATATWAAGVATITSVGHKAIAGGKVTHSLFSRSGYNGERLDIASVPSADTYTVAIANDPGGSATGGQIEPQYYNGVIRRVTDGGASGTIGAAISYRGNGWIHMLEAADGRLIFGWDGAGGVVPAMAPGTSNLWCKQASGHYEMGRELGGFAFDGCVGRDGVLYLLMVYSTVPSCVYASADDGVTWQALDLGLSSAYDATNITCNPAGPSGRLFISGNAGNKIKSMPDFTRAQLRARSA